MVKSVFSDGKGLVQSAGSGVKMEQKEGLEIKAPSQNDASYQIGRVVQADVTVGAAATSGKSAGLVVPAGFICHYVHVVVTTASTNAINLQDIGTDADPNGFIDGLSVAVNSAGDKGTAVANGILGNQLGVDGSATTAAMRTLPTAADEIEVVLSNVPGGSGCTLRVTLYGSVLGLASS